jgi:uncharacterized protein YbaR (Trm112 family)
MMLIDLLACPRCRSDLNVFDHKTYCANLCCDFSCDGFPLASGQPVIVDFDHSVFRREDYHDSNDPFRAVQFSGSLRTYTNATPRELFRSFITGRNPVGTRNGVAFLTALKEITPNPVVLIIGGGSLGEGVATFYDDPTVTVIATDVYPSPFTSLIADGHQLPFKNQVFDGVWIQAVLEHVLEPQLVVDQIHRVLKPGGVIYAETPFMQQVHEGAYDFTRFTLSGHRWLFRGFDQLDAGVVSGAGTVLVWSIRYFWRALGLNTKIATLLTVPFFWLRFFDKYMRGNPESDSAGGVFFLGIKSTQELHPKEIIDYYRRR